MRTPSKLELKFSKLWSLHYGQTLVEEFRFHPTRKWRFDFAHPETRTGIEIEGGHWSGGRHTRGAGFEKDCEKYNSAIPLGWDVFRLTGRMITPDWIKAIKETIDRKLQCQKAQPRLESKRQSD